MRGGAGPGRSWIKACSRMWAQNGQKAKLEQQTAVVGAEDGAKPRAAPDRNAASTPWHMGGAVCSEGPRGPGPRVLIDKATAPDLARSTAFWTMERRARDSQAELADLCTRWPGRQTRAAAQNPAEAPGRADGAPSRSATRCHPPPSTRQALGVAGRHRRTPRSSSMRSVGAPPDRCASLAGRQFQRAEDTEAARRVSKMEVRSQLRALQVKFAWSSSSGMHTRPVARTRVLLPVRAEAWGRLQDWVGPSAVIMTALGGRRVGIDSLNCALSWRQSCGPDDQRRQAERDGVLLHKQDLLRPSGSRACPLPRAARKRRLDGGGRRGSNRPESRRLALPGCGSRGIAVSRAQGNEDRVSTRPSSSGLAPAHSQSPHCLVQHVLSSTGSTRATLAEPWQAKAIILESAARARQVGSRPDGGNTSRHTCGQQQTRGILESLARVCSGGSEGAHEGVGARPPQPQPALSSRAHGTRGGGRHGCMERAGQFDFATPRWRPALRGPKHPHVLKQSPIPLCPARPVFLCCHLRRSSSSCPRLTPAPPLSPVPHYTALTPSPTRLPTPTPSAPSPAVLCRNLPGRLCPQTDVLPATFSSCAPSRGHSAARPTIGRCHHPVLAALSPVGLLPGASTVAPPPSQMHAGADPLGAPPSFSQRRSATSNLPNFELPPPPLANLNGTKYSGYSSGSSSQGPMNQNGLTSVGNLLTPPNTLQGDCNPLSPGTQSTGSNSSHAHAYPQANYWPQTSQPAQYGPYSASSGQQQQQQHWIPPRSLFSPSSLNGLVRDGQQQQPHGDYKSGAGNDVYQLPPFSQTMSMSAPSTLPTMSGQGQYSSHTSPVNGQEPFHMRQQYGGSHSTGPTQHATFSQFGGPSPTQASPMSAHSHQSRLSPLSSSHDMSSQYQRPYGQYPLPNTSGAVMQHQSQMGMVGQMGNGVMGQGFNGAHGASIPHVYGMQHHGQQSQPSNDRPFKCDQCMQSFNRNHDLKRHKRIHLAVKPYPCGHCDKSFSRKDALKGLMVEETEKGSDSSSASPVSARSELGHANSSPALVSQR
ncbi:hypothetical protein FH972_021540 [Carpinus fangiana]|uniref:C2H2-type domain-containing protein n=1 Tax=Carpinus fangiana TaxID=176857 RepID=A0A5N6KPL3_9ROSI|nr:hypothetical protein FH972_021540 [Carpinus fangiana]